MTLNVNLPQGSITSTKTETADQTKKLWNTSSVLTRTEISFNDIGNKAMKIVRRGARADNGPSSIELNHLRVSLEQDGIVIRDSDIKDFVTKAHYDYRIVLTLDEIGEIIESLGSFPDEREKEVGKAFEGRLKKLLRIVQSCVDA